MTESNRTYSILTHSLLFIAISALLYGGQLILWGSQLPGNGEDACKNYFTVAYHIDHDTSYIGFGGMNFPFGEHTVFTDNQPLISNTLKLLSLGPDLLPWLVFLSMLLGSLALSRILEGEGVPNWIATISSIGVILLSPQLLRLSGHYSLAYAGLLPMMIYCLWMHLKSGRLRYQIALAVMSFMCAFIHPYFLIMMVLLWGLTLLIEQIRSHKLKRLWPWMQTIVWPLLPLLGFQLIMFLTDNVDDRPDAPYGFVHYRATWASVFLPLDFSYFLGFEIPALQSKEGGFFIGLVAWAGIIALAVKLIRDRKLEWRPAYTLVAASIPILLLALAFPFYIWKFDRLIKYLGPLQQFRGIARFAFVFFYTINILAIVQLGLFLKKASSSTRWVGGAILLLLFALDIWGLRNQVVDRTSSGTQIFHDQRIGDLASQIEASEFDAIIPLPYFHIGSENFRTKDVDEIKEFAFGLSHYTGLPLTAVQMSRTSLGQTKKQLESVSFLGRIPQIVASNPDAKFILLHKSAEKLNSAQKQLMKGAKILSDNRHGFQLKVLTAAGIRSIVGENVKTMKQQLESAEPIETCKTYRSFDEHQNANAFQGAGSLTIQRQDWTDLIPEGSSFKSNSKYELSFWVHANEHHVANTQIWYWEYSGDQEVAFNVSEFSDHVEQVIGDWVLCTLPFTVEDNNNNVKVMVHRDGPEISIELDEVLLRSSSQNYFRPGLINLNNRYAEP